MTTPTNLLGVNALAPAKDEPGDAPAWAAYDALLGSLDPLTPVRCSLWFHEALYWQESTWGFADHWFRPMDRKIKSLAAMRGPLLIECTPLPMPGTPLYARCDTWGGFAEEDMDRIVARFRLGMEELRKSLARYGIPESRVSLQIGNEPGQPNTGGNAGLPMGEWWDRTGALYARCVAAADWGGITLVLPALSVQDHDDATAKRERDSAGPILRKIARAKKGGGAVAAVHHRVYAPHLGTEEYAAEWVRLLNERLQIAREISGRPTAICSECYLFREDRGAVDDREQILRLIAPKIPKGVYLYRIGVSPQQHDNEMSVGAIRSAQAGQTVK